MAKMNANIFITKDYENEPPSGSKKQTQSNPISESYPNAAASFFYTMDYENKRNWTIGESKPNSNPIKPNFKKAKMTINLTLTRDYRKNDCLAPQKTNPNKANFQKAKMKLKSLAGKSGHTLRRSTAVFCLP